MNARRYLRLIRLDLEALESISASTGEPDPVWDNLLVRDANGLPILPGASLIGVIRQSFAQHAPDADERLFGSRYRTGGRGASDASAVSITDALAIGSEGQVIEGLDTERAWRGDPILDFLARDQPVQRDHVRLNSAGVVANTGKFTRAALPAGSRFRLQMELRAHTDLSEEWATLLQFLKSRFFRIGGATRSGRGLVRIFRAAEATLDLASPKDRADLHKLWSRLDTDVDIAPVSAPNDPLAEFSRSYSLELSPEGFFRFGAEQPCGLSDDPKAAKMLIESFVSWDATPAIAERLVIPASAIKGALRHRTAFHLACRKGLFAESASGSDPVELFGAARKSGADGEASGGAGRLVFHDTFLDLPGNSEVAVMPHSSLDRFTGGVRRRILFSEELLSSSAGPLVLRIGLQREPEDPDLLAAFEDSLADLELGWLGLGAGWAKGHGAFTRTSEAEDA